MAICAALPLEDSRPRVVLSFNHDEWVSPTHDVPAENRWVIYDSASFQPVLGGRGLLAESQGYVDWTVPNMRRTYKPIMEACSNLVLDFKHVACFITKRGWVTGPTCNSHSDILPIPPQIFTWAICPKFGIDFSTSVIYELSVFGISRV